MMGLISYSSDKVLEKRQKLVKSFSRDMSACDQKSNRRVLILQIVAVLDVVRFFDKTCYANKPAFAMSAVVT